MSTGSPIVPALRYADAAAAIDWLCRTFGFEQHLVVPGSNNSVVHAQLVLGSGMIMLGSGGEGEFDELVAAPSRTGAKATQSIYVVVKDVEGHCARARAEGAKIVMEPEEQDYGGKLYTCRDLEGHVWSFGSYDPWA